MAHETPQKQLSRRDLRVLATIAQVDERTCLKVLAGVKTQAGPAERVRAALLQLGLVAPHPQAIASLPQAR